MIIHSQKFKKGVVDECSLIDSVRQLTAIILIL